MKKCIVALFCFSLSQFGMAATIGKCNVHTWHDVVSNNGTWKVTLKSISQEGSFVDSNCNTVATVDVSQGQPLVYGFGFSKDANFDIAYTLTAVSQSKAFQSKACVFVISAKGPAQPQISALSYHGAKCDWKVVPGVGENFSFS
jgi:hypothetical protein